jgi:hypothetical protein
MTTPLLRARHLRGRPRDVRSRVSQLGHPEQLTGREPALQRTANELIAAERQLAEHQSRYLEARRTGDAAAASLAASGQDRAIRQIEYLRAQLYEERRRELLGFDSSARPARRPAERRTSLVQRLLGR